MTANRHPGVRLVIAVVTMMAVLIGAADAAAAPGSVRALDLTAPSLGSDVTVATPDGGGFSIDPGRALLRVTPAGGTASEILAWCVDPSVLISEGTDYPADLQTAADAPELAGAGFAAAGWLVAESDGLIAAAADPGMEAAAIQVAIWQLTGGAADRADVTGDAALDLRIGQIRALAAGRSLTTALALASPTAPTAVGAPTILTVTATPGAVVDLSVTSGAAALSAARVTVGASGTATVTLTASAPGAITVGARAQGGVLHRIARLPGSSTPQETAYVTPSALEATAQIVAVTPAVVGLSVAPPVTVAQVPVARVPAALRLTKRAPATVRRGRAIRYRLEVTNVSATRASRVVVRDRIPAGTFVRHLPAGARLDAGAVVWHLGALAPGASVTVRLTLRTTATVQGDILNAATASASNAALVNAHATTAVLRPRRVAPATVVPVVTG